MSNEHPVDAPWRCREPEGIHVYAGSEPIATFHARGFAQRAVADHNSLVAEQRLSRSKPELRIKLDPSIFQSIKPTPIMAFGRSVLWRWETQIGDDRFDYGYARTNLGALRKAKRAATRLKETR